MDTNTAIVLVVGLLALVAVAFLLVFRSRGKARFKGPFGMEGTLEGGNDPQPRPGATTAEKLKAGSSLASVNAAGGDVDVKRATAKGDITLGVESLGSDRDPKA